MTINVASAWLIGHGHQKCQDKVNVCRGRVFSQNHGESDYGLLVACDGAGSKLHSEAGAFTAAKSVERYFAAKYKWESLYEFDIEEIKTELRQHVLQDIINIASVDDNISDYACTLIFVLYIKKSRKYIYGHIGDGGIVGIEDDSSKIISAPHNGEYKNQTYFITDVDSINHFRLGTGINESSKMGFLICTDGISGSLFKYTKAGQSISPVCQTFCQWLMEARTEEEITVISKAYRDNLKKYFAPRSRDDLSLAVMTIT